MLEKIKRYKLVSGLTLISLLLVLSGFLRAMISLERVSGPFILHFDDVRGITAIGDAGAIIFAGIFGIVVIFLNGFLAFELEERNTLFGTLVAVVTLAFAILLFIAFAAIISVN